MGDANPPLLRDLGDIVIPAEAGIQPCKMLTATTQICVVLTELN
jgi:hypothetical protein